MHTFWLVMKVHLIKKHHYMFVRSHFWPILSVFQWSRARPSGRSPFSRGPWSERRALTSPSGVTWPATRKESSKTSNGPCTFTPLPIERSVCEHVPAQLRLRLVCPARQQQGDLHREAKRRRCPAAHQQAAGHRPGRVRVLHPTPTAATWAPTAPAPTSPVSPHLTLIHDSIHSFTRFSRRRPGRCVFHRSTLWFYSRLNQTHLGENDRENYPLFFR